MNAPTAFAVIVGATSLGGWLGWRLAGEFIAAIEDAFS